MSITLELPAEIEAGLFAEARSRGMSVSDLLASVVRRYVAENIALADRQPSLRNEQGVLVLYGGAPMSSTAVEDTLDSVRLERDLRNAGPD